MGAKILAVANQKGGVGKTTTALSLAAALGLRGKKVLLVDLDPHVCASIHMRLYPEECAHTVRDIFLAPSDEWSSLWQKIICTQQGSALCAAPGHVRLSELEGDLLNRSEKGFILRYALETLRADYDFIILDCPPHVGILLVNALVASDLLIVPIQTDFLALHGLKLLFDTIRTLNKVLERPIVYRALPTMYDRRARACTRILNLLNEKMGSAMFKTIIPVDTRFREASALGRVVYDVDEHCRGARAYKALAEEVLLVW